MLGTRAELLFGKERRRCVSGAELKNRLRELRRERGWRQVDLGEKLGVSRQSVHSIESGKFDPSLPLAFRIADLFDMTVEEIFRGQQANGRGK